MAFKNKVLNIEDHPIVIVSHNNEDYISLTDMARSQMEEVIIVILYRVGFILKSD